MISGEHYTVPERDEHLMLMRVIDELFVPRPFYGVPRMTDWLQTVGHAVNHKRVARLMRRMNLQAVVPVAHTILLVIYHLLKEQVPYQALGAAYLEQRDREQATRRHVKQLEQAIGSFSSRSPKRQRRHFQSRF